VETVHAAGCLVLPWTILTQADWERVLGMGADGAFCNDLRMGPAAK
jgi:glycerophosphoryl diester phosphodiesterase